MRSLVGKVTSNKMQKSVVVAVDRFRMHAKYPKMVRSTKKFMAHDEQDQCNIGDKVMIESCRPLSKHKSWTVTSILQRARVFKLSDSLASMGAAAAAAAASSAGGGGAGGAGAVDAAGASAAAAAAGVEAQRAGPQ